MEFNASNSLPTRFFDHAKLGLSKRVELQNKEYQHRSNLIEKAGNGLLHIVGTLPRSIKWVGRQFQDPRVVTVALTVSALFLATLSFYPAVTIVATKAAFTAIHLMLSQIPLWGVKLSAYVLTCTAITGFGARATGRFANADLMKAFYGLPQAHPGNPANMTIHEIRQAIARPAQAGG
jgi:hypothetical protein